MAKQLQARVDALVNIGGITLEMTNITGFKITGEVSRTRDPGARFSRTTPAPPDIEDGETQTDWDEAIHGPVIARLRGFVSSGEPASVGRIRRDGNGNRIGITTYTCELVGLDDPEGDTMGGTNRGMLVMNWAASGVCG